MPLLHFSITSLELDDSISTKYPSVRVKPKLSVAFEEPAFEGMHQQNIQALMSGNRESTYFNKTKSGINVDGFFEYEVRNMSTIVYHLQLTPSTESYTLKLKHKLQQTSYFAQASIRVNELIGDYQEHSVQILWSLTKQPNGRPIGRSILKYNITGDSNHFPPSLRRQFTPTESTAIPSNPSESSARYQNSNSASSSAVISSNVAQSLPTSTAQAPSLPAPLPDGSSPRPILINRRNSVSDSKGSITDSEADGRSTPSISSSRRDSTSVSIIRPYGLEDDETNNEEVKYEIKKLSERLQQLTTASANTEECVGQILTASEVIDRRLKSIPVADLTKMREIEREIHELTGKVNAVLLGESSRTKSFATLLARIETAENSGFRSRAAQVAPVPRFESMKIKLEDKIQTNLGLRSHSLHPVIRNLEVYAIEVVVTQINANWNPETRAPGHCYGTFRFQQQGQSQMVERRFENYQYYSVIPYAVRVPWNSSGLPILDVTVSNTLIDGTYPDQGNCCYFQVDVTGIEFVDRVEQLAISSRPQLSHYTGSFDISAVSRPALAILECSAGVVEDQKMHFDWSAQPMKNYCQAFSTQYMQSVILGRGVIRYTSAGQCTVAGDLSAQILPLESQPSVRHPKGSSAMHLCLVLVDESGIKVRSQGISYFPYGIANDRGIFNVQLRQNFNIPRPGKYSIHLELSCSFSSTIHFDPNQGAGLHNITCLPAVQGLPVDNVASYHLDEKMREAIGRPHRQDTSLGQLEPDISELTRSMGLLQKRFEGLRTANASIEAQLSQLQTKVEADVRERTKLTTSLAQRIRMLESDPVRLRVKLTNYYNQLYQADPTKNYASNVQTLWREVKSSFNAATNCMITSNCATYCQPTMTSNLVLRDPDAIADINEMNSGWAVYEKDNISREASSCFRFGRAINESGKLHLVLMFLHGNPNHLLGCFSVQVTASNTFQPDGRQNNGNVDACEWQTIDVVSAALPQGYDLERLNGGRLLVTRTSEARAAALIGAYHLTFQIDRATIERITAMRLNVHHHYSLPQNGPGLHHANGNFVISHMKVLFTPDGLQ